LLEILSASDNSDIAAIKEHLEKTINPERLDSVKAAKKSLRVISRITISVYAGMHLLL